MTTVEEIIRNDEGFRKSRLQSLYSDFSRLQDLNPEGYDANVDAWGVVLLKIITSPIGDSVVSIPTYNPPLDQLLSLPDLGKPKNLGIILDDLVKQKVLVPATEDASWVTWGWRLIGTPYSSKAALGELIDERYISPKLLAKLVAQCLTIIDDEVASGDYTSKLYSNKTLHSFLQKKIVLSTVDFDLLLKELSKDKCKIRIIDDIRYVKFDTEPISDDDVGIINLKTTLMNISNRNKHLELKINAITTKTKELVSDKNQIPRLKNLLRMKRTLSQAYHKSLDTQTELNSILIKINESSINAGLYQQLVSSTRVLKNLNSEVSVEAIEDIKAEIDDEVAKVDEASELLAPESDTDMEQEYQKLLREVQGTSETEAPKTNEESELLNKLDSLNISGEPPVQHREQNRDPITKPEPTRELAQ